MKKLYTQEMPSAPLVTVAMPSYNSARYIAETIESILNQTFTDFEFIIYDDGSTDNSIEIIKSYQKKDQRILLLGEGAKNRACAYARQQIVNHARGKYIAIADSDDVYVKRRLEIQVKYMEKHPHITVLSSNMYCKMGNKNLRLLPLPGYSDQVIKACTLLGGAMANPTCMMRREALLATKVQYNEQFKNGSDHIYSLDLMKQSEYPVYFKNLRKHLGYYRIHPHSITASLFDKTRVKQNFQEYELHASASVLTMLGIDPSKENRRKFHSMYRKHSLLGNFAEKNMSSKQKWQEMLTWTRTILHANKKEERISSSTLKSTLYFAHYETISIRDPYFWFIVFKHPNVYILKVLASKIMRRLRDITRSYEKYRSEASKDGVM